MAYVCIKRNASGLQSIGNNYTDSDIVKYKSKYFTYVEFSAEFELTNYSNQTKTFSLYIDSPHYRQDGVEKIGFQTFDGKPAVFELAGNETRTFKLDLNHYNVSGGKRFGDGHGGDIIREIILSNDNGEQVKLIRNYVGGIETSR
jgi:hypothetical protein